MIPQFFFPKRSDLALDEILLPDSLEADGKRLQLNRQVRLNGWTLGLDVGSNSIGWMLVRDNPIPGERNLLGGVRVFPAATDQPKGQRPETSRTVERRTKRGMRRQQQRRDRRRRRLLYELLRHGFLQLDLAPHAPTGHYNSRHLMGYWHRQDEDFRKLIFNTDPYELRAKGLDEELTPAEFARCLIHLNQHRGFKSNRKAGSQSDGVVKTGIERTKAGIRDLGCRTLGEYLSKLDPATRKRGRYLHRDMIREEFKLLWETQRDKFPTGALAKLLTPDAWTALGDKTIFWQRPFDKVTKDRIGDCNWEDGEKRERRDHRLAQRFRIVTEVDNLRFDCTPKVTRGKSRGPEKLTLRKSVPPDSQPTFLADDSTTTVEIEKVHPGEQRKGLVADHAGRWRLGSELRARLIEHLMTKKEVKFDALHKILDLPEVWSINLASGSRPSLKGNETEITLRAAFAPEHVNHPATQRWDALTEDQRNSICEDCLELEDEELRSKAQISWGMNEAGVEFLLDPKNTIGPGKHGMLSRKAMSRILEYIDPDHGDPVKFANTLAMAMRGLPSKTTSQITPTSMLKVAEQEIYGTVHKRQLTRHIYGLLPFPPGMEFSKHKAVDGRGTYLTPQGTATDQPTCSDRKIIHQRRLIDSLDQIPKEGRPHYQVGDPIPTHLEFAEKCIHGSLNGKPLNDPLLFLEDRQPIMNPVVRKALFEVRKVVNEIIRSFGLPSKIRIELARSARGSIEKRTTLIKEQGKNEIDRDRIRQEISKKLGIASGLVRNDDIVAYQLWEEQGQRCIYTGQAISLQDLLQGDVQVDHILPFSQSMDDSRANRVVALGSANRDKGNRTPSEWLSGNPAEYNQLLARVDGLVRARKWKPNKAKRFTREGAAEVAEDSPIIARKLVDTQYIARQLATYLSCLYPANRKYVEIGRGDVTAALRSRWGLDSIHWELNGFTQDDEKTVEKNRGDHRHHALDAAVIALTSARTLQHYAWHKKNVAHAAREARRNRASSQEKREFSVPQPWANFREELMAELDRMIVSHTPTRRVRGPLHKETYYGPTNEDDTYAVTKPLTALTPPMIANIMGHGVRRRIVDHLVHAGVATLERWNPTEGGKKPKDAEALAYDHPTQTTHLLRIADKKAIAPAMAPTDSGTLFGFSKSEARFALVSALVSLGLADIQMEAPEAFWQVAKKKLFKGDPSGKPVAPEEESAPEEPAPEQGAAGEEEETSPTDIPRVPFGDWFEIPAVPEGNGGRVISPRCFARLHDATGGLNEEAFHHAFYAAYPALKPIAPWDGAPPIRHVRVRGVSNTVVPVVRSSQAESFVEPGSNHHVAMFRVLMPEEVEDKEAVKSILAAAGAKSWTKKMGPKPMKQETRELIHFEARTLLEAAREKLALLKIKKEERPRDPSQVFITQPKRNFGSAAHVELVGHLVMNDVYLLSPDPSDEQTHVVRMQKISVAERESANRADVYFRDIRSVFVDKAKALPGSEFRLKSLKPGMLLSVSIDVLGRLSRPSAA
jgi:CRISPR/Cas system Type II protein with McrA/HNH and RuvC-like nuclease domain